MMLTVRIKKRYGDFLLDVDFSAGGGEAIHQGFLTACPGAW